MMLNVLLALISTKVWSLSVILNAITVWTYIYTRTIVSVFFSHRKHPETNG